MFSIRKYMQRRRKEEPPLLTWYSLTNVAKNILATDKTNWPEEEKEISPGISGTSEGCRAVRIQE